MIAGRCTNLPTQCKKAASGEAVPMSSPDMRCPECGARLLAVKKPSSPLLPLAIGGAAFVALGGLLFGIWHYWPSGSERPPATSPVTAEAVKPQLPSEQQPAPVTPAPKPQPQPQRASLIHLQGSNTIGAELGPKLAQGYLRLIGDTDVRIERNTGAPEEATIVGRRGDREEEITVSAHGSKTAFEGLAGGVAGVGMASRRIKPDERQTLMSEGDMTSPACEHVLALDGIAVVVNHANQINALSKDQLKEIFSGAIQDWSEVGGAPGRIAIFARDDKSGTYDTFAASVLGGARLRPDAKRYEDSSALASAVDLDANGIGFIGLPYIGPTKALAVSDKSARALVPNRLTVATEDYVLSRRLYLYTPASSGNPAVQRFVEFALSPAGQALVEETGFVSLTIRSDRTQAPQAAPSEYRTIATSSERLSTDFRFDFNSAALDNRALRDTSRLVDFLVASHTPADRIVLVGFTDNIGGAPANLRLSKMRAQAVADELKPAGITVGQVTGFGDALPVADNTTDDGRQKNRRVEVFLRP